MKIGITFSVKSSSGEANEQAARDDHEEEFDSPETIQAVAAALEALGHEVELLGEGEPLLRRLLDGPRPELVFNFAEGRGSGRCREARVPAVLEMLGIPYTGSDPLTLAATLDKDCAKRLAAAAGVPTPKWLLANGQYENREMLADIPLPAIVKPAFEGSSKGVLSANLIYDREELLPLVERLNENYSQPVLVEEFIDGDELTVGVVGHQPSDVLGIMRVLPVQHDGPFVYSLEVKRDWERRVRYESPAQLTSAEDRAVRKAALDAWRALGCQDLARIDFRLRDGVPYFLEANPLPGLSPTTGDLVLLARGIGVDYQQLIRRILEAALERLGQCSPSTAAVV